jgi:hypothetical protein
MMATSRDNDGLAGQLLQQHLVQCLHGRSSMARGTDCPAVPHNDACRSTRDLYICGDIPDTHAPHTYSIAVACCCCWLRWRSSGFSLLLLRPWAGSWQLGSLLAPFGRVRRPRTSGGCIVPANGVACAARGRWARNLHLVPQHVACSCICVR